MGRYAYDQAWKHERDRLLGMARLWDAGTFALFDRIGVGPGWHCLEVGAGAGSVSQWLARRVGAAGRVVAGDIDPRYVEPLAGGPLEVARIDVLEGNLEQRAFHLVYARLVAEHLGSEAVRRMASAVRPGGFLLLEDYDFAGPTAYPANPEIDRVSAAVLEMMSCGGFDQHFGRRLLSELRACGLKDVQAEGRVRIYQGGSPETAFARLSVIAMRERIVASGNVAAVMVDRALAAFDDPQRTYLSPTLVAAWGRAPEAAQGSV
jgi:SAM-dependent methyltransferase